MDTMGDMGLTDLPTIFILDPVNNFHPGPRFSVYYLIDINIFPLEEKSGCHFNITTVSWNAFNLTQKRDRAVILR